jgi:hypothetical protein
MVGRETHECRIAFMALGKIRAVFRPHAAAYSLLSKIKGYDHP